MPNGAICCGDDAVHETAVGFRDDEQLFFCRRFARSQVLSCQPIRYARQGSDVGRDGHDVGLIFRGDEMISIFTFI